MLKDDEDTDSNGSNRLYTSHTNDADMLQVEELEEDGDDNTTDQSDNVHDDTLMSNDDDEDDDTDVSDENLLSTNELSKRLATPTPKRNFTLVLSKTKTSSPTQRMPITSPAATSNGNLTSTTPIKVGSHSATTASPIRIKLSMRKLPVSGNVASHDDSAQLSTPYDTSNSRNNPLPDKNTIQHDSSTIHNEDGQSAPVAKTVEDTIISMPEVVSSNYDCLTGDKALTNDKVKLPEPPKIPKTATGTASKRRPVLPTKQVRIPPLTSPGLRMLRPPIYVPPPTNTVSNGSSTTSPTFYTPQQIFDVVMTGAGYTHEQRTKHPHRGSSVQRTIDDMFDTNVHLSLHPIELIPKNLWNHVAGSSTSSDEATLPHALIAALENSKKNERHNRNEKAEVGTNERSTSTRKRPRRDFQPMRLHDMVPVSLSIPYPEWYLQKRVEYVNLVKKREMAIVEWQTANEERETTGEDDGIAEVNTATAKSNRSPLVNPVDVPPIPRPPDPPKLHEFSITSQFISPYIKIGDVSNESSHPYYLPKSREHFVEHLDPNCFHITDGRYFGLETNLIADPNFIGPNAPGLNLTTNTGGLATATTSTTTSTSGLTGGGMTMILSASYHSAAAVAPASVKDEPSNVTSNKVLPSHTEEIPAESKSPTVKFTDPPITVTTAPPMKKVKKVATNEMSGSSSTTRTLSDLREIMEGDDAALIETFREFMVRSVVHTFRSHKSVNIPFRGPNNEMYPDVGKAFALFGGIKPCDRCKGNKQGVGTSIANVHFICKLECRLPTMLVPPRCNRYFIAAYGDVMVIQIMTVAIQVVCYWFHCWTHQSIPYLRPSSVVHERWRFNDQDQGSPNYISFEKAGDSFMSKV